MGLGNFFKRQLKTVIEWNPQDPDLLFYRFPTLTEEIKSASQLIVNPGQGCLLVYQGRIQDVIDEPGTYTLKTANHPFITNLVKVLQSLESEHRMYLYFFRKAELPNQRWGTATPIKYMDPVYHFPVELGVNGNYSVRLEQPRPFFENLLGVQDHYSTQDLRQLLLSRITPSIATHLAQGSHSYQQIDAHLAGLSKNLHQELQETFTSLGLILTDFRIEGTAFNEETLQRIDRIADSTTDALAAREVGLDYIAHEKVQAMRDAARNEGGLAGAGLQLGAGLELGKAFNLVEPSGNPSGQPATDQEAAIEQLKKLKSLLDDGILTQQEFDAKKKELLERL